MSQLQPDYFTADSEVQSLVNQLQQLRSKRVSDIVDEEGHQYIDLQSRPIHILPRPSTSYPIRHLFRPFRPSSPHLNQFDMSTSGHQILQWGKSSVLANLAMQSSTESYL